MMKNKKGFLQIAGLLAILPMLLKKASGIIIGGIGVFFVFDKYKEVGFTTQLLPTFLFALALVLVGQWLVWFFTYRGGIKINGKWFYY